MGSDNLALEAFIESNAMVPGDKYFVTYGKQHFNDRGMVYYLGVGRAVGPTRESLAGEALNLNYTSSTLTGRVICVNTEAVDFPR